MKRTTALITAAVMALCMTACGDAKDKPASAKEDASSSSAAAQDGESSNELSDEELIKGANACAKTGYNAVVEYLADLDVEGKISEATEQGALEKALKEIDDIGEIAGTVGVRFDDTEYYTFTVQFRMADNPEIIGQYPEPPQSVGECPEWNVNAEGECTVSASAETGENGGNGGGGGSFGDAIGDALTGGYISKSKLKTANGNAKTGFNAVAEYIVDLEVNGKLSTATEQEAAEFAAQALNYGGSGIVGVKFDGDLSEALDFHVFWRENEKTGIIGRYPDSPQSTGECPAWEVGAEASYSESSYDVEEDEP